VYAASVALAVLAAVFALNALISCRERGFVELFDLPAAIAFAILSVLVAGARGSRSTGDRSGGGYLVTALAGGVVPFVSYWIATLVLALQAVPVSRGARARSAA
jgi:hypothetical protein